MIGVRDSFTLARTKLYARPVLLALTLSVCGVLFGILFAGVMVASGAIASARAFALTASGGKYLVSVTPVFPQEANGIVSSIVPLPVIARLKALQADYIAQHKVLAKQLGTTFDETSIPEPLLPNPYADKSLPAEQRVYLNPNSPAYAAYVSEQQISYAKSARNTYDQLQQLAKRYGAKDFYNNSPGGINFGNTQYLPGGKEDLTNMQATRSPVGESYYGAAFLSDVQNSQYVGVSSDLIGRYVLPENDRRKANSQAVPVIITATEAITLFGKQYGLSGEPASPRARIDWLKQVQSKLNGVTYESCYRNQADIDQLLQVKQVATEIEQNKNKADFVKPTVIYGLPTTPCGDRVVLEDRRTPAERNLQQQQADLQLKLGVMQAPQRQLIKFVVVGVMPVQRDDQMYSSIPAFLSAVLSTNYRQGAMIPLEMYNALPAEVRQSSVLFKASGQTEGEKALLAAGLTQHIVAFATPAQARKFMAEQGCPIDDGQCSKPYIAAAYATNYLLFDDVQAVVVRVVNIALPIALSVAGLIVGLMMARIMVDSRRETAVFRAIGAKRRDIMSIYLMYTLMVAAAIALAGAMLGWLTVAGLQLVVGNDITAYARVAYGIYDTSNVFNLMGTEWATQSKIVGGILLISLVAVSLPLARNVRRSPIDDMRDE